MCGKKFKNKNLFLETHTTTYKNGIFSFILDNIEQWVGKRQKFQQLYDFPQN